MLVFLIRSSWGGDDCRRRVDVFLSPKTLGRYLAAFIYFFLTDTDSGLLAFQNKHSVQLQCHIQCYSNITGLVMTLFGLAK